MKLTISFFKKLLLFNLMFFVCSFVLIPDVFAGDEASGYGYPSPSNGGGSGNCLSQWGGCTPGFARNMAFRLTMVDLQGKKIEGTKSVDFSSNVFYKCTIDGVKQNCPFSNYSLIKGYYDGSGKYIARYDYKYSEKFNDYSVATEDDKFIMYYDSKQNFVNQYTVEKFLKNDLLSTGWSYKNLVDLTFYDMFLHYCGFLKDNDTSYTAIDSERKQKIYNSVIIFEPAYPVYYYSSVTGGTVYRYGTVTELARTMLNNPGFGIDYGLSNALRKNVSLCINKKDKLNNLVGFEAIKSGVDVCSNDDYQSTVSLQDLVNDTRSFGISVGTISGSGINKCLKKDCPPDIEDSSPDYVINVCDQAIYKTGDSTIDKSDTSSSKISFLSDKVFSPKALKQDYFKVSGSDENQSLYCYDSVEYHLDDLKSDISGKYNKFIFVNPRPGKLTVSRYCLMGNNYSLNEQSNIDSYKNSAIRISFYGKTYDIYPSDSESNNQFNIDKITNVIRPVNFSNSNVLFNEIEKMRDVTVDGNKYKYVSYSFELNYIVPQNLLFVGNGNVDKNDDYADGITYNAYISLANFSNSFGYSNNMINTEILGISNEKLSSDNKKTLSTAICPFTYKIKDDNESKSNINFRVISLDNPFPARDGSSRMPSENWLYDENNVFNYITTNRGVLGEWKETGVNEDGFPTYELVRNPELIYSQREPMYSITLTPSTMLSIRSYNKKYSYYSMYELGDYKSKDEINLDDKDADKLKCNDQGRECYSEFLRDSRYIPQNEETISGDCFMSGGESKNVRDEFNSYYGANQVFTKSDVQRYYDDLFEGNINNKYGVAYGADLNFNGRMDSEDIEIMTEYAKVNKFENKDEYDKYVESTDDSSILDAQIYRGKYIKYYTCANKSYKSGGPVEEEK